MGKLIKPAQKAAEKMEIINQITGEKIELMPSLVQLRCKKCGHYANMVYYDGFVYCSHCGNPTKKDLNKKD
jgi:uncharacterized OB-fold protein